MPNELTLFQRRKQANLLLYEEKYFQAQTLYSDLKKDFPKRHHGLEGLARIATRTQQWNIALTCWEEFIERFPQLFLGYAGKGSVLLQLERYQEAEAIYQLLNQKFPQKHHGLEGLARVATRTQQWNIALTRWKELTQRFPQIIVGYFEQGNVLIQRGNFSLAREVFTVLQQRFPETHHGWEGLARIYMRTQQWELALNQWERLIDKFPLPQAFAGYCGKGAVLIQLEKYHEAERFYRDLHLKEPNKINIIERLTFLAAYTDNWQFACDSWQKFINKNQLLFKKLYRRNIVFNSLDNSLNILLSNGKLDEAELIINSLSKCSQSNAELTIWRSNLERGRGKYEISDRLCHKGITTNPEETHKFLRQLALNAWDEFDLKKTIEYCYKLDNLNYSNAKNRTILSQNLILLSRALIRDDQENNAIKQLHKAIKLWSANLQAYILLLEIICFYQQDYGSALKLCNLAIQQGVWHQQIILYRAISLSALGETKYAIEVINEYIKTVPSDKIALMYRVQLLRNDGQYEASLQQLNEIYIEGGYAPLKSQGTNFEFSVSYVECFPEQEVIAEEMVSVVMTVYKRDELLPIAINSVLNQTYRNLELIIVDDASPDDTWEWLQEFSAKDSLIKLLQMAENSGTYVAKNEGMLHVKGDYIAFMDSDDWSHPYQLETQVNILKDSDAVAVTCGFFRVDANSNIEYKPEAPLGQAHITICFKKDPVINTIGFFDAVRTGADTEHWSRIALLYGRNSIKRIDYPLLISSRNSTSITGGGALGFPWYGPGKIDYIYWASQRKWHRLINSEKRNPYMPHPFDCRRFDVPDVMLP